MLLHREYQTSGYRGIGVRFDRNAVVLIEPRYGLNTEPRETIWFFHDIECARAERQKSAGSRLYFKKKDGSEILLFSCFPNKDAARIADDVNFCIRQMHNEAREALAQSDRLTQWERNQRIAALSSRRARDILQDSRKSDRKYGRENDVDAVFIDSVIRNPCHYCAVLPTETCMSIDRIDPKVGHLKTNVLPACLNCNLTRGSMPFSAWMLLAPKMREARELRLLEGWERRTLSGKRDVKTMPTTAYHGRSFRRKYELDSILKRARPPSGHAPVV